MSRNVGAVARNKTKNCQDSQLSQLCADCGATEAEWASINRGVRVCIDCCSVHRSLGRHVSQIKSCQDKDWHPHTWNLVCALSSGGANSVWEHTLLDPTVAKADKQKPTQSDHVHPVKADFIRAKHQMLSFVIHPPTSTSATHGSSLSPAAVGCAGGGDENGDRKAEEGDPSIEGGDEEEASQELHSSVRTANLVTSLRLLSQGADPNYYHKARGNYPLHVAASSGQAEQAELLLVYGAIPQSVDANGSTPAQCASIAGHGEMAARLTDVQFELVHRLVCYLSDLHMNKLPHSQPYRSCVTGLDSSFALPSSPAVTSSHGTRASSSTVDTAPSSTPSTSNNTFSTCSSSSNGPVTAPSFFLPPHLINLHQYATDHARQARARLIKMPSVLLEELAADLYDEVDRRELEAVIGNSTAGAGERCTVPFLPVNPLLSSTRNQARQKLARLREAELCSLVVDLLVEARRRAAIVAPSSSSTLRASALHDAKEDDPLYDSVCSEDDYSLVEQLERLSLQQAALRRDGGMPLDQDYQEVVESPVDEQPFSMAPTDTHTPIPLLGSDTKQDNITNASLTGGLPPSQSSATPEFPAVQVTPLTTANSPTDTPAPSSLVLDSETESQAVVMPSALTPSQQHLITLKFIPPPPLSPSVSTIDKVTAEQYDSMRHKLETSERTIRELQDDNQLLKTQMEQLFSTVHHLQEQSDPSRPFTSQAKVNQLRRENSSLRSLASPSPPLLVSTPSPTMYHMPYQSLPPLHNGDTSPAFNSSSRSFASMPYNHQHQQPIPQHFHQQSDPYPTYNSNNTGASIRHFPPPPTLPPPPIPPPSPLYDYPIRSLMRHSTHPLLGISSSNPAASSLRAADSISSNSNFSTHGGQSIVAAQRPYSMFEARDQRDKNMAATLRRDGKNTSGANTANTVSGNTYESICNSGEWEASHLETTISGNRAPARSSQHQRSSSFSDDLYSGGGGGDTTLSSGRTSVVSRYLTPHQSFSAELPAQSEVVGLTESITRGIQELLVTAQSASTGGEGMEAYHQQFVVCANRISLAVKEMVSAFPKFTSGQLPVSMHEALVALVQSAVSLKTQCQQGGPTQALIQAAFAIAQATKNLVTCFQ